MADVSKDCYVHCDKDVFKRLQIVHQTDTTISVQDGDEVRELPLNKTFSAPTLGDNGVQDMVLLEYLNEASLLENLKIRFHKGNIYTYSGSVLISVNPYKNLPIYTPAVLRYYVAKALGSLPPHVYAIADTSYRSMMTEGKDQAVLISGESGAGKTEAAKKLMQFIAHVSEKERSEKRDPNLILPHEQVLATNPILEAFGNAKTVRNDNSSRFGKLLDMQFSKQGFLVGARLRQFLLERSRVVKQGPGERNYHVFYYVCAGADKTERDLWQVTKAEDYPYTATGATVMIDSNPKFEYQVLKRAMTTAGFKTNEQHTLFGMIVGILFLSKIKFEGGEKAEVVNMDELNWVAYMLQCDAKRLRTALITRENTIRGEVFHVPFSVEQAERTRDTLAKELYNRNFKWMVERINVSTNKEDQTAHYCSLLDIFGFEIFESNSFEQLCINYANERLQFHFNEHIFRLEQDEYKKENLDVSKFTYVDNQPCIDLMDKKPVGLLFLLDEEARFPNASDASFLRKLSSQQARHKSFSIPKLKRDMFIIKHFAGDVNYLVDGFLEKTTQRFSGLCMSLLRDSKSPQIASLFKDGGSEKMGSKKSKETLGLRFRNNLGSLMKVLNEAYPHYIRCIKPNETKSSKEYNHHTVIRQLRCSGVLETIRIRRGGYPNRRAVASFNERYAVLLPKDHTPPAGAKPDSKEFTRYLVQQLGITPEEHQIGISKVFLKDAAFHALEGRRNQFFHNVASMIQKTFRGFRERKKYKHLRKSCQLLQLWFQKYLLVSDCEEEAEAALEKIGSTDDAVAEEGIAALEALAIRDTNIDVIVDLGAIDTILVRIEGKHGSLFAAGTRCLGRLANSTENATAIARRGGVHTMVTDIDSRDEKTEKTETTDDSIELLDHLSKVEQNVEVVVREGGVEALTKAILTSLEQAGEDDSGAASRALGTLTRNKRAARLIGRNHDAIKTIVDSVASKPKFARLCGYSINCLGNMAENKHNLDAIADLGGIGTCLNTMRNHMGNVKIMEECSRVFCQMGKVKYLAEDIGKDGGIELALEFLAKDPKGCGVPAAAMLKTLLTDNPRNLARFVKAGGIKKVIAGLAKSTGNLPLAELLTAVIDLLAQNPQIAELMAGAGAARVLLDALRNNVESLEVAKNAISALTKLAAVDEMTLDFIRSEGALKIITHAMEIHADDDNLLQAGKGAIDLVAEEKDLRYAMDTVGRSRLEEQTADNARGTEDALAIVSNLALLEKNIDFIIEEGGIPVMLSVIGGGILDANKNDRIAANVASALRAVGRLLVAEKAIPEFQAEGGVETLASVFKMSTNHTVLESTAPALEGLVGCETGAKILMDSEILPSLVNSLLEHPEFSGFAERALKALNEFTKHEGAIDKLKETEICEALGAILDANPDNATILREASALIKSLLSEDSDLLIDFVGTVAEPLLVAMNDGAEDADIATPAVEALTVLANADMAVAEAIGEMGASEAIAAVLEAHPDNDELVTASTRLLARLSGKDELAEAIESARELSEMLAKDPDNEDVLEALAPSVTLIANMAGEVASRESIIEQGGLEILPDLIKNVSAGESCLLQEEIMSDLALIAQRLALNTDSLGILIKKDGTVPNLIQSFITHEDYEGLGARTTQTVQVVLDSSIGSMDDLIEMNAVEGICSMILSHPLNDVSLIRSSKLLAALGSNPQRARSVLSRGGGAALIAAIRHLTGSDDGVIHAFGALSSLVKTSDESKFLGNDEVETILKAFHTHQSSGPVIGVMADALADLATTSEKVAAALSVPDSLQLLSSLLKKHVSDGDAFAGIANLVGVLCENEEIANALLDAGVFENLAAGIAKHPDHAGVQSNGSKALERLCMASDRAVEKVVADPQLMEDALAGVHKFATSEPVICGAVRMIGAVARNDETHDFLKKKGALNIVQWAKKNFPENAAIADSCEFALTYLDPTPENLFKQMSGVVEGHMKLSSAKLISISDTIGRAVMMDADLSFAVGSGSMVMMGVLQGNMSNENLVGSTLKCTRAFTDNASFLEEFSNASSLSSILGAMQTHDSNEGIIENGMGVVCNLVCGGHAASLRVEDSMGSIVSVMKKYSANEAVMLQGIRTLANSNLGKLTGIEDSVGLVLSKAMDFQSNPSIMHESLKFALQIATSADNSDILKEHGIEPLLELASTLYPEHEGISASVSTLMEFFPKPVIVPEVAVVAPEVAVVAPLVEVGQVQQPQMVGSVVMGTVGVERGNAAEGAVMGVAQMGSASIQTVQHAPVMVASTNVHQAVTVSLDASYAKMKSALNVVSDLKAEKSAMLKSVTLLGDNLTDDLAADLIEEDALNTLVIVLNKNLANADIVGGVCKALLRLCRTDDEIEELVACGGIAALLRALRRNIDNPTVLVSGIALLAHLADNDHLKTLIGLQGGIEIVIEVADTYLNSQKDLLVQCFKCFANLVKDNPANMHSIVKKGGKAIILKAWKRHKKQLDLCDISVIALTNLCEGSDANKEAICHEGGMERVKHLIQKSPSETEEMLHAFTFVRAMASVTSKSAHLPLKLKAAKEGATYQDNLTLMVEGEIIAAVVAAMGVNDNAPLLTSAIHLFTGFASSKASHKKVVRKALQHGLVPAVAAAVRTHKSNEVLLQAAIKCLTAFAADRKNAKYLLANGVIELVLLVLAAAREDSNEKLLFTVLSLIQALVVNDDAEEKLVQAKIPSSLLSILTSDQNIKRGHFVKQIFETLTKLTNSPDNARSVAKEGCVRLCVQALKGFPVTDREVADAPKIQMSTMRLLTNLCSVEENARLTAEHAAIFVLESMQALAENQIFLQVGATLLGNMAIYSEATQLLLDLNVVPAIMLLVKENMDYPGLEAKMIRVFANILQTAPNKTTARTVLRHADSMPVVEELQKTHSQHQECKKSCKTFIKKMNEGIDLLLTHKSIEELLPKDVKTFILAGSTTRRFAKSAPKTRKLRVDNKFEQLMWLDPKGKRSPQSIPLVAILEIRAGACTPSLRKRSAGHKRAEPARSFAVFYREGDKHKDLGFEVKTEAQLGEWVDALSLIVKILRDGDV